MSSIRKPVEIDGGFVVRDSQTLEYYCGNNKWDKQLRKAQIYHSVKWVDNFVNSCSRKDRLTIHPVIMRVEDVR